MSNLISDSAAAVLTLLDGSAATIYEGPLPAGAPAPPYIVVWINCESMPDAEGNTLAGTSDTLTTTITCHCVGANSTAARAMSWQARNALLDVIPTVSGRTCAQIRMDSSRPPTADEETGSPYFDAIDVYRFYSYPA